MHFLDDGLGNLGAVPEIVAGNERPVFSCLHHCVGSFASRHARAQTTIWLMRRADAPDEPYVTVEVAGRQVRQAHGLCNRNLTAAEGAWLKAWCKRSGYRYDARTAQGVRG